VDTAGVATVSTVHAASTSSLQMLVKYVSSRPTIAYLETWPASQRTPQLHHHPADFVTHGSMALVVVDWGRSSSVTMATTSCASCPGSRGGGDGSRGCALGACLASTQQAGLQGRASTCSGARSGAAGERHDG